jgi:hypothetical protein
MHTSIDHQTHNSIPRKLWSVALYIAGVLMLSLIAFAIMAPKAKAEGVSKSSVGATADDSSGPAILHSGCGFGVGFSYLDAMVDVPGTNVGIGASGEEVTPSLGCNWIAGSLFLGAEANYSFIFGNLNSLVTTSKGTIGATGEAAGVLKLGVMLDPTLALYAHGDYGTMYFKGLKANSSQEFGGGVGMLKRLPTAMPLLLDARWTYDSIDISNQSTANLTAHDNKFGLSLIYQFYGK